MKTTVPNKSGSGTAFSSGPTKEQVRMKLEKELEDVNKHLVSISKGKKSSDCEFKLLERKVYIMLKLRQWKEVLEEGYRVLGKKGPNVIIYKCILVSLCRLGKFEDDVIELLNQWKNATPKCSQMSESRRKMDGFLSAIRSGMNASGVLQNVDEVLGLNSETIFSNNSSTESEPSWRFRPPPQRHNTFSICPRITSASTCIYGDECLLAHSKEELKEWQFRSQRISKKGLADGSLDSLSVLKSSQSTNVYLSPSGVKEPIPPTYRLLPPACMYYLLGLVKKVKETDNIKKILVDNLLDVKIKYTTSLEVRKTSGNSSPILHKWEFMIAAKQPLATVTLLHDVNRDNFGITGASFFNSKKQSLDLVDMHPNNKSQKVLNTFIRPDVFLPFNNGWPEWCCYQVDVVFQTDETQSTVYEQNIVFDFKNDPKLAKRLSVTVEPPKTQDYNLLTMTPKPSLINPNCEAGSDTDENNSIEEDLEPISEDDGSKKNIAQNPWGMRSAATSAFELPSSSILKTQYDTVSSETSLSSHQQMDYSRSDSESENSFNLNAGIDEKHLKMANNVKLLRKISMDNFQLLTCSSKKLDIWMFHDPKYFEIVGDILRNGLIEHHYKLLFPELPEPKPWNLTSLIDEFDNPKKLENQNNKQYEAMCAIMKQPVNPANSCQMAPVVITGPPGSGKTYVMAQSVLAVTSSKINPMSRVLICTYSNETADLYVEKYFNPSSGKFKEMGMSPSPLRIYPSSHSVNQVPSAVRENCLLTVDKSSFRHPTIDEIFSHRIIIVTLSTCVELVQLGLPEDTFSYIFIDEATQMIEIESLYAIVLAGRKTKLVLCGDLNLLGPDTFSLEMSSNMSHLSMVDRLNDLYPNNHPSRIKLQETYTNQKEIVQFVSKEFYSSSLICTKSLPSHPMYYPMCFSAVVDGDDAIADTGEGYFNMKEVLEIRDRIIDLLGSWPQDWGSPRNHAIGVVTSYAAQATGLRIRLKLDGLSFVDIETLPDCLTKQYRVVLVSPVRTFKIDNPDGSLQIKESHTEVGLFTNRRAINTAFTRAECLLIVVGDLVSLCNVGTCRDIWREYVSICSRNGSLKGLKYLNVYKPDSAVQITLAVDNKFEPSNYNIPPTTLNYDSRAGEPVSLSSPSARTICTNTAPSFSGDCLAVGSISKTPPQNSINVNYGISPSQLKEKMSENIVEAVDPRSNGNLSSIWDSDSDFGLRTNISSNSSIWESYLEVNLGQRGDLQTKWTTTPPVNNPPIKQDWLTSEPVFDSRLKRETSLYRNPFELPDVRLFDEVKAPIALLSSTPHNRPNPFFGVTNNNLPTKSMAVTRPIAPPAPVTRQSYQPYPHSNEPFHQGVRRNGYVPPPRMLRTLNSVPQSGVFENFNSGFTKETSKDFDFFAELGLEEYKGRENGNTLSSSSSSQGSTEFARDSSFVLSSTEFPQLSQPSDWVQVKSSKKSKTPPQQTTVNPQKKSKKKSKTEGNKQEPKKESKELTVEQKIQGLMEMGFEKRQTIKALQACDKDLQRSVEWLILYAPTKKEQRGAE